MTLELSCILLRNRGLPYYGEIRDCIIKEMTDLTGMLATGFSKLPGFVMIICTQDILIALIQYLQRVVNYFHL